MLKGFVNIDKPSGLTSHDCVSKLRRCFGLRRVGHGGTLDPAATGVLPIALGRATRFLPFLSGEKVYRATFILGLTSATDDAEGEILRRMPCPTVTQVCVQQALASYVGDIDQVPPMYSAIRRQGKHLYELAREGVSAESLQLEPRSVHIERIDVLDWRDGEFPEVDVDIACGTGTYIRAIARDLGKQLGVGGLMSHLRRQQSGPFLLETSVPLQSLLEADDPTVSILPVQSALGSLPGISLKPELAYRWCCGQKLSMSGEMEAESDFTPDTLVRVLAEGIRFLGVGRWTDGTLEPVRVLVGPDELM